MAGEAIKVVARFRPPSAREAASQQSAPAFRFADDGRTVSLAEDGGASHTFDAVLPMWATQAETYGHVSGIVDAVLQGYNGTILAYGQTGSGKTHSVMGTAADPGVLPRAVQHLFETLSGAEFDLTCSYLEIYKEVVRDLLETDRPTDRQSLLAGGAAGGRAIRETAKAGVYVEGLRHMKVASEADVLEVLQCGNAHRMVSATLMNSQSSRSHALLTLTLQQTSSDGSVRVSKLNIADLAGSEKISKTGASGVRLDEAKKINGSLSALSHVISALADGKAHVPYRNSKLTRILQESLGGNSKTLLLVACSPAQQNAAETKSTLQFAVRAKAIKNAAVVNTLLSPEQIQAQNDKLRVELRAARAELALARSGQLRALAQAKLQLAGDQGSGEPGAADTKGEAWREAPPGPSEAVSRELEAAKGQAEALQEELTESQRSLAELEEALTRRDAEAEELHDILECVQVLHGVALVRTPSGQRSARDGIDALRRIVFEAESARLRELESGEDSSEGAIAGLRAQLAEQHARLRKLEPLAGRAEAAEAEAEALRDQLQALAQAKLHLVSQRSSQVMAKTPGKGRRNWFVCMKALLLGSTTRNQKLVKSLSHRASTTRGYPPSGTRVEFQEI